MKNNHDHVKLTSAELSYLWTIYQSDSMSICVFSHFLEHIEDEEIKSIILNAKKLSEEHIHQIRAIYNRENIQVPQGFTDADVNVKANRLFEDVFYLKYLKQMSKAGLGSYGYMTQSIFRQDILGFFNACLQETIELNAEVTKLLLEKGIAMRPPTIPYPQQLEFVHKQSFVLEGLGKRESLTGTEIANLHSNIQTNHLGTALATAFSQVAQSDKVRKYIVRGKDIAIKQVKVFSDYLRMASLPRPMDYNQDITESTEAPFSDKLIMFLFTQMIYTGIGNYGISISESQRSDLVVDYSRLTGEILKFAEDGINIMIANQWLEQQPLSADRKDLSKN